jgi:hypothetical protein
MVRIRRDLFAGAAWVLLAASGGLLPLITKLGGHGPGWIHGPGALAFAVDAGIGALASALLWFRRRSAGPGRLADHLVVRG